MEKARVVHVGNNGFNAWKEVDFFLRLHRHLPDDLCDGTTLGGEYLPFCNCMYRENGEPINVGNDFISELQKNPEFVKKEEQVNEAVKQGKTLFKGKKLTKEQALLNAMSKSKEPSNG